MSDIDMISWDDQAASWDQDADVTLYAERAWASLFQHSGLEGADLSPLRVLDFGCGTGNLTIKLAPCCAAVVALDPAPKMIEVLRAKLAEHALHNVITLVGDLATCRDDAALERPFDLIVASSVCTFLDDYPETVRELATMLRSGGRFVQWDWRASEEHPDFGMSEQRIADAYSGAGLELVCAVPAFELERASAEPMTALIGVGKIP